MPYYRNPQEAEGFGSQAEIFLGPAGVIGRSIFIEHVSTTESTGGVFFGMHIMCRCAYLNIFISSLQLELLGEVKAEEGSNVSGLPTWHLRPSVVESFLQTTSVVGYRSRRSSFSQATQNSTRGQKPKEPV